MITQPIRTTAKLVLSFPKKIIGTISYRAAVWFVRNVLRRRVMLFERQSGIGDIICTFPSVLAIRQLYPDALFIFSVQSRFKEVVKLARVADYIVAQDWSSTLPKVNRRDYDRFYQPWLEAEKPMGRLDHLHMVDEFAEIIGVNLETRQPKLYVSSADKKFAIQRFNRSYDEAKYLIGIHVGPSWFIREWPAEHWNELVRMLHTSLNCRVIQLGDDHYTGKGFMKSFRVSGAEDWVGKLTLSQCAGVIEQLDVFVGIDSGLLHVAGAVGTPVVGLFGAVDPALRLYPETPSIGVTSSVACLGCHHRKPCIHWCEGCPFDASCMKELNPGFVLDACTKMINHGRSWNAKVPTTPDIRASTTASQITLSA